MIRRETGDDHICVLTFDRPDSGANIFDAATLDELNEHLDAVEKDASLRGLIIASAKKSIFVAGADLKTLLQAAKTGEMRGFIEPGQQVFNRLADLKIPTVAAIHGASAGGGYEVALACDYRVASDAPATRIGLPETSLGLLPAWGGCTRLPRLIGAEKAAEVILKGKLYSAQEALKIGLVDEIAPPDQLLDRAREKLRAGKRKMEERSMVGSSRRDDRSRSAASLPKRPEIRRPNVPTKSSIKLCRFRLMNRCGWSWTGLWSLARRSRRKTSFAIFSSRRNTRRERRERRLKKSCTPR